MRCRYEAVNYLTNIHQRHAIMRGMECIFLSSILSFCNYWYIILQCWTALWRYSTVYLALFSWLQQCFIFALVFCFSKDVFLTLFNSLPARVNNISDHQEQLTWHNKKTVFTKVSLCTICTIDDNKSDINWNQTEDSSRWRKQHLKYINKSSQRLPNTPVCRHQWIPC